MIELKDYTITEIRDIREHIICKYYPVADIKQQLVDALTIELRDRNLREIMTPIVGEFMLERLIKENNSE